MNGTESEFIQSIVNREIYNMIKIVGIDGAIKSTRGMDRGVSVHNDSLEIVNSINDPRVLEADAFIQTNILKPEIARSPTKKEVYEFIKNSGKPFLVIDSATFRRYSHLKYVRIGWNSYKWDEGDFNNKNSPPDRWNQFQKTTGIAIKDWHSPGDSILIMGQKEGDSSLNKLYEKYNSFYDWLEELIIDIRNYSDRPIIIRPHPRGLNYGKNLANKLANKFKKISVSENVIDVPDKEVRLIGSMEFNVDGITRDFQKAYYVVTYNSLSGVESVCDGIPTFSLDSGSMARPVMHHDISKIENLDYNIDRTQWCYDSAYTQWESKETRWGAPWAHLKGVYFK